MPGDPDWDIPGLVLKTGQNSGLFLLFQEFLTQVNLVLLGYPMANMDV